jgi:hypothetical protein
LTVAVEQIVVTISGGVVAEIARASDERTVRYSSFVVFGGDGWLS